MSPFQPQPVEAVLHICHPQKDAQIADADDQLSLHDHLNCVSVENSYELDRCRPTEWGLFHSNTEALKAASPEKE